MGEDYDTAAEVDEKQIGVGKWLHFKSRCYWEAGAYEPHVTTHASLMRHCGPLAWAWAWRVGPH